MARTGKKKSAHRRHPLNVKKETTSPTRAKESSAGSRALDSTSRDRYFEITIVALLLIFGIYLAITYYGHQAVPNSDFPAFAAPARSLLALERPSDFKRLPVLGFLHVGLSKLVGGQHPLLTAGWFLNSLLCPLNLILLYLVGKKLLGKSAWWFALLAILNPWTVKMLVDPIVETTLIFFTLLTFYFILRRSSWCYLFAAIAAMTRYECTALIPVAFVLDMITRRNYKERIKAFVLAGLAFLPMALWLYGYKYYHPSNAPHYAAHFKADAIRGHVGIEYVKLLWQVTFEPVLQWPGYLKALYVQAPTSPAQTEAIENAARSLFGFTRIITILGFIVALPYSFYKRNWNFLALLIFLVSFTAVHATRTATHHRYCVPITWITLLIAFYGLQSVGKLMNWKNKIPPAVILTLQILLMLIAGIWLIQLVTILPKITPFSYDSAKIPYVAFGVVAALFTVRRVFYKTRFLAGDITVALLVGLLVTSNQFTLARQMGNGDKDREFKMLADWYVQNAQPREKLVTTLPHIVSLYAPKYTRNFHHTGSIRVDKKIANDLDQLKQFVRKCYQKDITYVAWDSRLGLTPRDSYYKKWSLNKIKYLCRPQNNGPFQYLTTLKLNQRRYIHIFRLNRISPTDK